MSDALYDYARASATAERVRKAFPCQGVSIMAHPKIDSWVLLRLANGAWRGMPATAAIDYKRLLRAQLRAARKGTA